MKDLNYVHIVGNLGVKPVFRKINSNEKEISFASLSVATNHRYKSGDQWISKTTWHNVIAWQDAADYARTLESGDKIDLSGYLSATKFRDQDGKFQHSYKVICENIRKL